MSCWLSRFKFPPMSAFTLSPVALAPFMVVSCPDFIVSVSLAVTFVFTYVVPFSFISPFAFPAEIFSPLTLPSPRFILAPMATDLLLDWVLDTFLITLYL